MDVKEFRKEISYLIDNIKEHSDRVTEFDRIPQLELENILSKIKKLYEESIIFNYLYKQESFITNQEYQEIIQQGESEDKIAPAGLEHHAEPKPETLENDIAQSLPEPPVTKSSEKSADKILSDINTRLKEKSQEKGSLNEKIGQNELYSSISSKLQGNPISDLSKAIGVNERFEFIKELFGNDPQSYKDAVAKLNSVQNFAQAEDILNHELALKYSWKADSSAVKKFVDLVQRRHI